MARRQGRGNASAALAVVTALALLQSALATNYPINGDGTWGFGENYQAWADGVPFKVGDSLEFKYGAGFHSVFQLASKTAFDNCDISSPLKQWTLGDDTVPLTAAGTAYFVCGIFGHCGAGMKFSVDVISGQTANPPTAPPTSPATPPATPPTATPPTTPPTIPPTTPPTAPPPTTPPTTPPIAPPPTTPPTSPPTAPPTASPPTNPPTTPPTASPPTTPPTTPSSAPPPTTPPTAPPTTTPPTTPSKAPAKAPSSPPTARGPAPPPESSAGSVQAALFTVAGAVALAMLV